MKLVQMKCPNCDADLSVDDGIESFYCQYCGTKIILDGQSDTAIKAKVASKAIDKVEAMHKARLKQKAIEEEKQRKQFPFIMAFIVIAMVVLFMALQAPGKKEDSRIESLYSEIQQDIASGNYDAARMKLPGLRYDKNVSSSKAKNWDDIREELEVIIDKSEKG